MAPAAQFGLGVTFEVVRIDSATLDASLEEERLGERSVDRRRAHPVEQPPVVAGVVK